MSPRQHASPGLVTGVLLMQVVVLLAVTAATPFCCAPATGIVAARPDCCKADNHSCPLTKKVDAPAGGTTRLCGDGDAQIVSLIFGTVGVLRATSVLTEPALAGDAPITVVRDRHRSRPIDVPPPRA